MSFEEFQYDPRGGHLRTERFLAILNLCVSLGSVGLTVWEEMLFEEFQDDRHGGHFGYRNGTI